MGHRPRLAVCVTDGDYEAWRAVRIAVVPGERTQARNSPMLRLNEHLGYVVGSTSITVTRGLPL